MDVMVAWWSPAERRVVCVSPSPPGKASRLYTVVESRVLGKILEMDIEDESQRPVLVETHRVGGYPTSSSVCSGCHVVTMQVMKTLASRGCFWFLPVVGGHGQLTSYYPCRVFRKGHLLSQKRSAMMAACRMQAAETLEMQGRKQARFRHFEPMSSVQNPEIAIESQ